MPDSLLAYQAICDMTSLTDIAFSRFEIDSRKITQGCVFIALKGDVVDGRRYIDKAIENGAVAVLAQADNPAQHGQVSWNDQTPVWSVWQLAQLIGQLASANTADKIQNLQLTAVTGTNGKTSVAYLLQQCLSHLAQPAAYIGTLGVIGDQIDQPLANTTPIAIELHNLLADVALQHTVCALEVSSHALTEKRIAGLTFPVAAFTNLSHDHLDFHGSMDSYFTAKKQLFTTDYANQTAVINLDDSYGQKLAGELPVEQVFAIGMTESVQAYSQYLQAEIINVTGTGFDLQMKSADESVALTLGLLGQFNISNALVVAGCLVAQGYSLQQACQALSQAKAIKGRMEVFQANNTCPVVVDFAHTPDGLSHAIAACKQHLSGQLHLVFGCGGDRDQAKRAVMGAIAQQSADVTYITNDNPRSEAPELIAEQILAGYQDSGAGQVEIILDRKAAIKLAIGNAAANDIVLIAGKGHEVTQEIAGIKHHYDERAYVEAILERAA